MLTYQNQTLPMVVVFSACVCCLCSVIRSDWQLQNHARVTLIHHYMQVVSLMVQLSFYSAYKRRYD